MLLTDAKIKALKPKSRAYKISDQMGLQLQINPSESKIWQFRYRFLGKEKLLSFGPYPEVGLLEAREKRDDARKLLREGADPSFERKRQAIAAHIQANNTFKFVADEFIAKLEAEGAASATHVKTLWLAKQLEPDLGSRPISEIEPFELLTTLKRIERKGNFETAKRLRSFASRVFRYAIITARARPRPVQRVDVWAA
jgi:hypothetical protein